MSKGKSDKHIEHYHTEQEEEYFDAAFDLAFDEAFDQALSAPPAPDSQQMHQSWLRVQKEITRIAVRKKECVP
ncbi:hypothetical protein N6H13_01195 [Paenibacillus sp. CC-CFT742]|nr:hypothetical protein [Paenibacillus sp. CC-CFT742]WJH29445.1 hypothetical protein N6H13_01195 [Paenibacillus sp. CC-CFT742]